MSRLRALTGIAALLGTLIAVSVSSPIASAADTCPNADKRWGPSQFLPDCRAYELVTPVDTNGQTPFAGIGIHSPMNAVSGASSDTLMVTTPAVSADGTLFQYNLFNTSLADVVGNGSESFYQAERTGGGWRTTTHLSPDAITQADTAVPGGATHDFRYQGFFAQENSASTDNQSMPHRSTWMRQPDGGFRPVGEGTLPADPDDDGFANGFRDDLWYPLVYITPSGDHQVIEGHRYCLSLCPGAPVPLTPDAPTDGRWTIYDRAPDGLHLVSKLPDGSPAAGNSVYAGASRDGSVIAFYVEDGGDRTLYARVDNEETKEIVRGPYSTGALADATASAGVFNDRVYYVHGRNLYVYDLLSEQTTAITSSGDARYVRVSADGRRVFFLSESQLDGSNGTAGEPNLYVWDGSAIEFIATTRSADTFVTGPCFLCANRGGIDDWTANGSVPRSPAVHWFGNKNPTRSTEDGGVFVFTSSADVTGQNPGNHFQVYRWDAASGDVICVSCPLDGTDTTGKSLLTDGSNMSGTAVEIPNLTEDGQTLFFESDQQLVPRDADSVTSVYQWRNGGLALLSSGDSGRSANIVGAMRDGSQVFISTTDLLVPDAQRGGVPAIYSVRVGGGFALGRSAAPCSGDVCLGQGGDGSASAPPSVDSESVRPGNVTARRAGGLRVVGRVRGARLRLAVRAPGAGMISVAGRRVGNARKRVDGRGRYVLAVGLTKRSVGLLQRRSVLRVPVRVTFVSRGGGRSSKRLALTVRRVGGKRSQHVSADRAARR